MLQEFHHVSCLYQHIGIAGRKLGWKWFVCPLNITPNSPHYLVRLHYCHNDAKTAQVGRGKEGGAGINTLGQWLTSTAGQGVQLT